MRPVFRVQGILIEVEAAGPTSFRAKGRWRADQMGNSVVSLMSSMTKLAEISAEGTRLISL